MNIIYLIFGILFCYIQEVSGDQNLRNHLSIHKTHDGYSNSNSHNPIRDFIFGFFLIIVAIPFLWYNERRQAITEFRLDNASKDCQSINSNEVNPNMEGKLVHMCGISSTNELVGDPEFGVSEMNLIKLNREVEMYQWIKKTRSRKNSTETYYVQQWSSEFHDSSDYSYGHSNEKSKWIIEKQEILNKVVYLGQYLLSESLKSQVTEKEIIKLNTENVKQAQASYGNRGIQFISELNNYIHFQQAEGQTVNGDLRVQFFKYSCGENSIVSEQSFNTFRPYMFHDKFERTVNEDHLAGTEVEVDGCCFICKQIRRLEQPIFTIDWIFHGLKTQNEAFGEILKGNRILTFCVRIGGYLAISIGFCLLFSPITYIVSWLPLLGNVLASVTTFVFGLISFTIALPITLLVISLAWVWYRPKIGIVLILIASGIGAGIYYYLSTHQ